MTKGKDGFYPEAIVYKDHDEIVPQKYDPHFPCQKKIQKSLEKMRSLSYNSY